MAVTYASAAHISQSKHKGGLISHRADVIGNILKPILPKLSEGKRSHRTRLLQNFKPCEEPETDFDVVHFISYNDPNKYILSMNCFGCEQYKTDSQSSIRTAFLRNIYVRFMDFIRLHHTPEYMDVISMGFGRSFTIQVNSEKETLIELYLRNVDNEEYRILQSSITFELHKWLNDNAKDCNVVSLRVETYSKNGSRKTVVYGNPYLTETLCGLNVIIQGSYLCSWHPSGIKVLSEALLELADLNENWGVVQIGCLSAVPTLLMAKACKKLAVIDPDKEMGQFISTNALKNKINNVVNLSFNFKVLALEFLDMDFKPCSDVCAVIYKLEDTQADENFLKGLQKYKKLRKIIFVSSLQNVKDLEILVMFCEKERENSDGFVATKAIPLDVNPFQSDIQILYLLERESDVYKTNEEAEIPEKLRPKMLSAVKQAELLSFFLMPYLPKLVKDLVPRRAFHLETLRPCPPTETMSDVLEVHTDIDQSTQKLEMKYTTSVYGKSIPIDAIHSDAIKAAYYGLIGYMERTNIPLYNPTTKTGFWKNLVIRMNHSGEVLVIVGYHKEHLTRSDSCDAINSALKLNVMTLGMRGCKVTSLLIKTYESTGCTIKCLYGPDVLVEEIDGFKINVCDRPYTLMNQHAVIELSRSIAEVAWIDNLCTVVQVGVGYDAATLYLSKLCKHYYLICDEKTVGNQTLNNAKLNNIENFTFYSKGMPKKWIYELLQSLLSELSDEDNICILLYEFPQDPDDGIQEILVADNVKKVLFLAEVGIETQIMKLATLCNSQSPFIITKGVPVDILPDAENVKMIYLLERESSISYLVEKNMELNAEKVTKLLENPDEFSLDNTVSSDDICNILETESKSVSETDSQSEMKDVFDNAPEKPNIWEKTVKPFIPRQAVVKPMQIVNCFTQVEASSSKALTADDKKNPILAQVKPYESFSNSQETQNTPLNNLQASQKMEDKKVYTGNIHDEWCRSLDVEDHFHNEVVKLVREKLVKTNLDYQSQMNDKQMYAAAQAKCLSDMLEPIVPVIIKRRSPELIFRMEDLKPCPVRQPDSHGFKVVTGIDANSDVPEMKFDFYSSYKSIPMRPFNSDIVESTYKHLMNVISNSELELFNPQSKTGFWQKIFIKVTNNQEKMILIETFASTKNVAKRLLNKATEELQSYFRSEARSFDIGPIVLSVKYNSNLLSSKVIFPKPVKDKIDGFKVKLCDDLHLWIHNPPGLVLLSDAIVNLGRLKKTTTVLQLGCYDGITFFNLAKQCRKVFIVVEDLDCTTQHEILDNARDNKIDNIIVHVPKSRKQYFQYILEKSSLKPEPNICVLVYTYSIASDSVTTILRDYPNIKKIICVSDRRNPQELKCAFGLCKEQNVHNALTNNSENKAFVITKAVTVDLSPYEDNVKMLYLLERANELEGYTELNNNYNETIVSEFEKIKILQRTSEKFTANKSDESTTKKMLSVLKICAGRKPSVPSFSRYRERSKESPQKLASDDKHKHSTSNSSKTSEKQDEVKEKEFQNTTSKKRDENEKRDTDSHNSRNSDLQNKSQKNEKQPDISEKSRHKDSEQVKHNVDHNHLTNVENEKSESLTTVALQKVVQDQEANINEIAGSMINKGQLDENEVSTIAKNLIEIGLLLANKAATTNTVEKTQLAEPCTDSKCDNSEIADSTTEKKDVISCKDLYELKKRKVYRNVKSVSDALKTAVPSIDVHGNFGLLFELSDFRSCPNSGSPCGKLQALSGISSKSGKIEMILQESSADIRSDVIEYLYDKILRFMRSSPYEMYDPRDKTGLWHSIGIVVNDLGEAMLVVKVYVSAHMKNTEERMSELCSRLRNCFLEGASKKSVVSLVLRICYPNMTKVKVLIGEDYINYNIAGFKIHVFDNSQFFSNPNGLELLSNTLVEVADLNQSLQVLQLGSEFDLPTLKLAKECEKMYVFDQDKKIGQHLMTNMSKNDIRNLKFMKEDGSNKFVQVLKHDLHSDEDICVVLFEYLYGVKGDTYQAIMSDVRVKKIVLVSEQLNSTDLDVLISLCKEVYHCSDPFIIKMVVPVEMCPYSTCVKMVYLLVRTSSFFGRTTPVAPFSVKASGQVKNIGDKRNLLKSELSAQVRPVTESYVDHFSRETHFSGKHKLQETNFTAVNSANDIIVEQQLSDTSKHSLTETDKTLAKTDKEKSSFLPERSQVISTDTEDKAGSFDSDVLLQQKINSAVYRGGYRTTHELRAIANLKNHWASLRCKSLSESLKDVLPVLVKNEDKELIFYQGDMISCPVEDPPYCSKFEAFTGINGKTGQLMMAYGIYPDGSLIPVTYFHSYAFQCIYEKVMEFIKTSGHSLFNPNDESGFWKSIVIVMNQCRELMLTLTGHALKTNSLNFKKGLESLSFALQQCLASNEIRNLHLVSAVLHVKFASDDDVTIPVIGDGILDYEVQLVDVSVHALSLPWPSIYIVKEVAESIVKLTNVNKSWGVIQIGCGYGLETLYLALACKKVLVFDSSVEQSKCITYSAQKIGVNVVCLPEEFLNTRYKEIVETDLASCSNICLLVNKDHERFLNAWLRHIPEIKQIIWVSKLVNRDVYKILYRLCNINNDEEDPLLIYKVIPVDLSVYENDIDVIYHLARKSQISHLASSQTQQSENPTCTSQELDNRSDTSKKRRQDFDNNAESERYVKLKKSDDSSIAPQSSFHNIPENINVPCVLGKSSGYVERGGQLNEEPYNFSEYNREIGEAKKETLPTIINKVNPESEFYSRNLSYGNNRLENLFSYQRTENVNKDYESPRNPGGDHMKKVNDPITFHYDHSISGNRGSVSGINIGDIHLQSESFLNSSNILESRSSSSYRSPSFSDLHTGTNVRIPQHDYRDGDLSHREIISRNMDYKHGLSESRRTEYGRPEDFSRR